ncbi:MULTISPECIES: type II toxin-antitoxin system VapC family toxin [Mycobacterium]|uniref:Ribonuclease VapC n=1 Tax=Mycobacterium persicum TaxID=1487726 RepID=A0A1X0L5Y1_9MYCO|nr:MULTISPECIES: type II toxin-antitoxin system VapC family toxin [Mycobacterium]KZS83039.1 ribonuclease [Mycobacterium persicum]ORB45618.1 VapC toxin family PIN domain ribonuclease [Mycobacterium persicum]ORB91747.1 VapC toxin family PIN domain ribonuclease [Mycobacterium persicum]ORB97111.1 VapC toxin family PIN domain ribonuclease [Mycobacterium persicum]ORC03784.1 VapC toxin family PIN domain ribonuclease [Mycobacterium persicum]
MLCVDVNVLVYAHRADLHEHSSYRGLLEQLANDDEPLGLPDGALAGFVRVVTNRRVFTEPTSPHDAWQAVDALLAAPAAVRLGPGERHWMLFRQLVADIDASGNDIADAYLAAYALENNATLVSADRGFARFRRLRWRHPLDM